MSGDRSRTSRARDRSKSPAPVAGLFVSGEQGAPSEPGPRGGSGRFGLPRLEGIARASYRRERVRDWTLPAAGGLMEAGVVGVIADKVYDVHPTLLALISAAPMFGNLSSVLWARVAEGRPKVPLLTAMQTVFIGLVAAVAFLPSDPSGGPLLAVAVVLARLLIGGILTVRSTVWTLNYPGDVRSRITARLSLYTTAAITLTALVAGFALDADPNSFRWVYPLGAAIATIGLLAFARVELVGEKAHLAAERGEPLLPRPEGANAPESSLPEPPAEPGRGLFALLRSDPLFARYQLWQFVIGSANMIMEGPLILLVSRDLGASYSVSIALSLVLPLSFSMVSLPLWAPWMDRIHIAEFRAKHSGLWALSQAIVWGGAIAGSLLFIGVGRAMLGIARGGGLLAWQIGHNDFASPERAARYMGVHVTLTGVRGAFAPFLGMLLYVGWSGTSWLPAWDGIGPHMMGISTVLSIIGTLGYVSLYRRVKGNSE